MYLSVFCLSSGCATTPPIAPTTLEGLSGIYHRVEKGETLWRISKIYNLELDELVRLNKINDARIIEQGQLIFIPKSKNLGETLNLVKSNSKKFEDFIWPLKGTIISYFGQIYNNVFNKGINIQAPFGSDIIACRSGVVNFYTEELGGLGKTLIIDHGDNFLTVYSRISNALVKVGQNVTQGALIAKVGYAAREKKCYLHFEIRKGHIAQNPYYYLP